MSTRLATQRQFIISTSSAAAVAVEAAAVEAAKAIQLETDEEQQELELVSKSTEDVLTVVERRTPATPGSHGEEFEFCTEDGVVVAATLEDVMTQVALLSPSHSFPLLFQLGFSLQNCQLLQKKLSEGMDDEATTAADQLEVIRVVLPMDTSDSSQEAHLHAHLHAVNSVSSSDAGATVTANNNTDTIHTLPGLGAIKATDDLVQQVANAQLTVVHASDDDEGTPFITVTGEF